MSEPQPFGPPSSHPPGPPPPAARPAALPAAAPAWSVVPTPVVTHHVVTDRRPPNGAVVAIAWIIAVLTLGYMLPWAIAATRGASNQAAVGLLNLLLGWTFIGWVVALVMACQAHRVAGVGTFGPVVVARPIPSAAYGVVPVSAPAGWYPTPGVSGRRYWDGAAWTGHRAP